MPTPNQVTAETALAVSRAILDGRWDDLAALLDDDFTYTGDGFVFTKDEYIGFMQDMREAFSGLSMEFPQVLVDGDQVSVRFVSKAVNTGSFMGAPANKRNLEVHGIFIRKVRDGKVLQEWQTTDLLGVMKQIGFGALFGYSVFVGLFGVKQKRPVRRFTKA
jgi:predicted ester cyclase